MAHIQLEVSHSQLCIFLASLPDPFNEWNDEHVAQGFAWRPGSVSFRTIEEAGLHLIQVDRVERFVELQDDAVRVIEVPFEVPAGESVEIASIADSAMVLLPAGSYCLRCTFFDVMEELQRVELHFATAEPATFRVLVADPELLPGEALVKTANPAL